MAQILPDSEVSPLLKRTQAANIDIFKVHIVSWDGH